MVSKVSATVGAVMGALNALVLLDVVSLSEGQLSGLNTAMLAVGAAVAAWLDPRVPFGNVEE